MPRYLVGRAGYSVTNRDERERAGRYPSLKRHRECSRAALIQQKISPVRMDKELLLIGVPISYGELNLAGTFSAPDFMNTRVIVRYLSRHSLLQPCCGMRIMRSTMFPAVRSARWSELPARRADER
jgi:hypothetical protein